MEFLNLPTPELVRSVEFWVFFIVLTGALFGLVLATVTRLTRTGDCRWARLRDATARLAAWHCATCDTIAYTKGPKPPVECKRGLEGGL